MDPFVIAAVAFVGFIGLVLCGIFWESRRSDAIISNWAVAHGYEIVEKKQPLINLGLFRWEKPQGRTFYYITVRDRKGQTHSGWICCGIKGLGLLSNKIEVRWDNGGPPVTYVSVDKDVWPPPPTI